MTDQSRGASPGGYATFFGALFTALLTSLDRVVWGFMFGLGFWAASGFVP